MFLFIFIDPQISQITQIIMFVCPVCLNIFCPSVCLRCKNNTIHSNYRCFCLRFQHY